MLGSILLEHEPDIGGIAETWLRNDIYDAEVMHCGYKLLRNDRCSREGGVGLRVKIYVTYTVLPDFRDIEAHWIKVKLPDRSPCVGVIYRPPGSTQRVMKNLRAFGKQVFAT